MMYDWKLKIIMLGFREVGKTSFIKKRSFETNHYNSLGISIDALDCSLDNGSMVKCSIWEISLQRRFHFIYPTFFKDAAGCLLFFDLSNDQTFEILDIFVKLITKMAGNAVPIILIGTKNDMEHQVYPDEIIEFVENQGILEYYSTSIREESKRDLIFENLCSTIIESRISLSKVLPDRTSPQESIQKLINRLGMRRGALELSSDERYTSLSYEEKVTYNKFIEYFSCCPVCKKLNHSNYLSRFYFSKNRENLELKNQLLTFLKSDHFEYFYDNRITLGIPCCSCFRSFFYEEPR